MDNVLLLVAVGGLAVFSDAKRYCMDDSDCDSLGKLICVKTACKWGTCGCPAGKTAKFLGSQLLFDCVPNRRIGEYCSTYRGDGVCIVPNSVCDKDTSRCSCKPNYMTAWGGEACIAESDNSDTCLGSTAASLTTCNTYNEVDCFNGESRGHSVIRGGSGTCSCTDKERLELSLLHGHTSYWLGPTCVPVLIADTCLKDMDCPDSGKKATAGNYIPGGNCDNNVCVCESTMVTNYEKTACKEALSFGETCIGTTAIGKHCNGVKGLICGDICDMTSTTRASTCVCGPNHRSSGTTCTKIQAGASCHGDMNCKGFSQRGVCFNGLCQNAAAHHMTNIVMSVLLAAIVVVFMRQ